MKKREKISNLMVVWGKLLFLLVQMNLTALTLLAMLETF